MRLTRMLAAWIPCVAWCCSVFADDSAWSVAGPHDVVTIAGIQLRDVNHDRAIEVLVRYPDGPGPFPLVIFSHGSLSNNQAFGAASEHWASHGYVVIHPNHADSRENDRSGGFNGGQSAGSTKAGNPPIRRGGGAGIAGFGGPNSGAGRIERIRDVTSVLDALDQLEAQIPPLKGKLNQDAIAVAGHSFGAYVAQCHGGVKTQVDGRLTDLSDSRVKCVVPISAQGESQSYGLTADSWMEAVTPAMHITGTRDRSAPDRPGGQLGDVKNKVIPFERSPAGGKYLLIIEGATHVSFGGRLGNIRGRVDAAGLTKVVSLVFLDAWLRNDAEARAWLDGEASVQWLNSQAQLKRKL
ncbi:MAG: alpha/beta hydrolase family protein [Planctomycetaceae bacterium]